MSYTINYIYGLTYTRNNQVIFPQHLTGIKTITQACDGNFFTHQKTLRAKLSDITSVTPLKSIVGVRVLPDNNESDECFYFVNGYTVIAPNVVEFNIEPDFFHTYAQNASVKLWLSRTNHTQALRVARFSKVSEPTTVNPCYNPVFEPLVGNEYYPVMTVAVADKGILTGLVDLKGSLEIGAERDLIFWSFEIAPFITKLKFGTGETQVIYNAKPLRLFFLPSDLIPESVKNLPNATATIDNDLNSYKILFCENETKSFSYSYNGVDNMVSKFRLGTAYDNIDIPHNFRAENHETEPLLFSVRTSFNNPSITLQIAGKEIDITRGFEVNIDASDYAQYKSQQQVSDAIQKIGSGTSLAAGVGASIAAAYVGNYLQAGVGLANSITSFAKGVADDYERQFKVTANAGGNVGFDNLLSEWKGLALVKDVCIEAESILAEASVYGYTVYNTVYELEIAKINTSDTFFSANKIQFNASIPAPAAIELEQTFLSGIFISPFPTS